MKTKSRQFISYKKPALALFGLILLASLFSYKALFAQSPAAISGVSSWAKNTQTSTLGAEVEISNKTSSSPKPATTPSASSSSTTTSTSTTSTSKTTSPSPAPAKATPPATNPPSGGGDIAPESACPGESNVGSAQTVLVCMTSYARNAHGLASVAGNSKLMSAATSKAQDIINCGFSHTACGHVFNYWMIADGYSGHCWGENIAQGQSTPLEVFTAWMNSTGHRENILNSSFKDIGIAAANSSGGIVWVMELGGC